MFIRHPGLGLIPDWQFSMDPSINPKINPHVTYPEGMSQQTIQPIGPTWGAPGVNGVFDSPVWENRKIIVGGGLALAALGLGALVFKFLR